MPRCDGSEAARAGAADTLSDRHSAPLSFLHPDCTPVTLSDCERQVAELSTKHADYTKALKLLAQDACADRFEFAELSAAARWNGLAFDAWVALAALMHGAVNGYVD